ncbi:MAG: hypothetical protein ABI907_08790, partial [Ramlibacter sp.]
EVYECHAGQSRAVVDLKGRAVRSTDMRAPVAALSPAPTPRPASAIPLIASGFANISDVDAIPYLSDRGREGYREYLGRPTPKAFALSPSGHWASSWSLTPIDKTLPTDPVERAMVSCNRSSPAPCKLYAVNGAVVWTREAGTAAQPAAR